MKYSEELALRLKGVKSEEIQALKDQEAKEAEEAAAAAAEATARKEEEEASALEVAQTMIKDLEAKLEAKDAELKKAQEDLIQVNNSATQKEPTKYDASDVMKELFHKTTKEE